MSGWRIEDMDPPEQPAPRLRAPILLTLVALVGALVVIAVASDLGANTARHENAAPLPTATSTPVTFVMRSTGMASGGFWCQVTSPDAASVPPSRLIVIVTTDRSSVASPIPCVIPTPVAEP